MGEDFFSDSITSLIVPYDGMRSDDAAYTYASSKGLSVVRPDLNELFIDIDDECSLSRFNSALDRLSAYVRSYEMRESPSGAADHRHIVVTLHKDVDARTRVFIQALMGSDPLREMLDWQRLESGEKAPTMFFEKLPVKP